MACLDAEARGCARWLRREGARNVKIGAFATVA